MSPHLQIRWTPTLSDHVLLRRLAEQRWRLVRVVVFTAVAVGVTAGVLVLPGADVLTWFFLSYVGVGWGLLVVAIFVRPWLVTRRLRALHPASALTEEHTLSLFDWGLLLEVDGRRTTLPWTHLRAPRARRRHLFFPTPPRGGLLLPLASLGDEEDLQRFLAEVERLSEAGESAIPDDPVVRHPERWGTWDVSYDLAEGDYLALSRDALSRRVRTRWMSVGLGGLLLLCSGALGVVSSTWLLSGLLFVLGLLMLVRGLRRFWLLLLLPRRLRRQMERWSHRFPTGEARLLLGPAGLAGRMGVSWYRGPWRHVLEVSATDTHLLIYVSHLEALIAPLSAFGAEADKVVAQVKAWAEAAPPSEEGPSGPLRQPGEAPDPFAPPES